VVFAVLCGVASWAAAIVLPPWSAILGGSLRLGADPRVTMLLALGWGVVGGAIGSMVAERDAARRAA
jgi:p-aminobenzoyl-glutamate transporter AbgT